MWPSSAASPAPVASPTSERNPDNEPVPGALVFRVEASLLYFNVEHVRDAVWQKIRTATAPLKLVVCDLSTSPVVDLAGARMLATTARGTEGGGDTPAARRGACDGARHPARRRTGGVASATSAAGSRWPMSSTSSRARPEQEAGQVDMIALLRVNRCRGAPPGRKGRSRHSSGASTPTITVGSGRPSTTTARSSTTTCTSIAPRRSAWDSRSAPDTRTSRSRARSFSPGGSWWRPSMPTFPPKWR